MSWPVINPLGRYRFAKRQGALPNPPAWPPGIIDKHHQFWGGEENMTEGNPMLILERGEKVALPPAIWHQGRGDVLHDYKDEDFKGADTEAPRFADNYKKAGGNIELHLLRQRPPARPFAGPDQDRRHLREDAGVHRQASEVKPALWHSNPGDRA